jgi:hypothetical protein
MPFIAPSRRAARLSASPTTPSNDTSHPPAQTTARDSHSPSSVLTQLGESDFVTAGQTLPATASLAVPSQSPTPALCHDVALLLRALSAAGLAAAGKNDADVAVDAMADVLLQV